MKKPFGLLVVAGLFVAAPACLADNPIIQTYYTADPAPMVYKDKVYLYADHDENGSKWFTMKDWRVFSSSDMVNWTDNGSPLSLKSFSWANDNAWAGQCIERNGKFYWYVPMSKAGGGMVIGVAVSNSPTGPFVDALGHPLITNGWGNIDPTVYIDDDGQAYLYWGNPDLYYVKLNKDMITYDQTVGVVKVPLTIESFGKRTGNKDRATLYEEGPWFYKRNGLYYIIYSASGIPENICYATSPGPTGPWSFKGVVMPTQGGSFTNHCGVIDFKGVSYFFYHNGALPGGGGFTRSICIEPFKYNADGSLPTINMTVVGVAAGVGHLNPYVRNEAETMAWESGVHTEICSAGGMDVCSIENGSYIKVEGIDFQHGAKSFTAAVASETNGGNIEVHLDSLTGPLVGTCIVPNTGGEQKWLKASCKINGVKGVRDLYFKFTGGDGPLFSFNWWKFNKN